ncbi:protein FAM161A [Euwallacea fornicatus]|uniref:protein FAM161A n=1 Tax=Euwallacea fornicatus TaxID=995702 RepID=UPI00339038AE
MHDHNSSVYNNNCLKVPRNPKNDHPRTQFEQKFLNDLHNEVTKSLNSKMKTKLGNSSSRSNVKAFIDFFDSIPEYDDINHLSNKEFYKKLENLKDKQKEFYEYWQRDLQFDNKESDWINQYKDLQSEEKMAKKRDNFCGSSKLNLETKALEDEKLYFSDKEGIKPQSRRSVRIETPTLDLTTDSHPKPRFANAWEGLTIEALNLGSAGHTPLPQDSKSAPNSPVKTRRKSEGEKDEYDGITVPKPFQMTIRDEENKIVEELLLKINKPKEKKSQQFEAHEIPIESQIPLFDKIMEDRHARSLKGKEKRKAEIQAQMKPFSFTRRDEEIQELTKRFSKSLPCVYNDEAPLKIKKFKAKPVPRNLFSNYIYKKMHEDEFYRALQKKVRAEEMLKHASLPPSMAHREKTKPKIDVCPRSFRDLSISDERPLKKKRKIPNYKAFHDKYERELEELKNEFISTSPRPFKLKSSRRDRKSRKNCYRISSANSKSSTETRTLSSLDLSSVNRSNLAAVLRIQSARQRLEMDMTKKLEEAKLKEEARWREKLMRKKPVWQVLAYSHEEDLAMRLQLRRDEERLRNEEHRMRMELMLGRVNQQPTLFERQSQLKFPKTKEELLEQLHKEYSNSQSSNKKTKPRPKSAFSDFSDAKYLIEMKDEAVQVLQGEDSLNSEDNAKESLDSSRRNSKESEISEEKDQCECLIEERDSN